MRSHVSVLLGCILGLAVPECRASSLGNEQIGSRFVLKEGWRIQSSSQVQESGEAISGTGFNFDQWYRATVPSTILSALVEDGVYQDPYFGMNLRSIGGNTYAIGSENFMLLPMPPESPFRQSWWYRTEFKLPSEFQGKTISLHFKGINYRANIWLNRHRIATSDEVAGTWRVFEFDVTPTALPGETNCLAVQIFPPAPNDLAITFVDWAPTPPDKCMGIWRDVYLTCSGPVIVRNSQVTTRLDLPSLDKAHLTVINDVTNSTKQPVEGFLKGRIGDLQFSQKVTLGPKESKIVTFSPKQFGLLNLPNPRLWWPARLGPQNLYTLDIRFETGGTISDKHSVRFGIREITAELDNQDHLLFRVNGKKILIRGAGYSFDMMLRSNPERQEAELKYVRDLNLNTIRMEGKIEDDHFLDMCDEYGILVLAGWCCCDQWEQWANWKDENYTVAAESLKDQIRRLRVHPSLMSWMNGSDFPPTPKVESMYLKILREYNWPNPVQSSATASSTPISGKSGVKMTGPYLYVAPPYWLQDSANGGAHGFNTETCPGPAIPPVESLRRMLPEDHLWPMDFYWDYHAEGGEFRSMKLFAEVLNARYGQAASVEDFAGKAQVSSYEGYRAMFEAFGRNKYTSTGVIGWMLNSAWPSLHYHIYDYYLRQGGAYFGTKKANEPLHVQYSYDDRSIVVVNSYYQPFRDLTVKATVYNLDATVKFSKESSVVVEPDSVLRAFVIPELEGLTTTYFLRLTLTGANGSLLSSNFYWLSTKPDVLDWQKTVRLQTPLKSPADFTGLTRLPTVQLKTSSHSETKGELGTTHVTIENPTSSLAFFIHLKLRDGLPEYDEEQKFHEQEVLPVLWEDNYFSMAPGERLEVAASYKAKDLGANGPIVEIGGWNVKPESLSSRLPATP